MIPKKGEKITGNKTGLLMTSLTETNGVKVSPKSVFVQIYVVKAKSVLFLMDFPLKFLILLCHMTIQTLLAKKL